MMGATPSGWKTMFLLRGDPVVWSTTGYYLRTLSGWEMNAVGLAEWVRRVRCEGQTHSGNDGRQWRRSLREYQI